MSALHPLTRRTAVVAALLLPIGTTGCDALTPERNTRTPATPPEVDGDARVVASVLSDLEGAVATLTAAVAAHPGLGGLLTPLVTAHTAHRDLLATGVPDRTDSPAPHSTSVPRRRRAAVRAVRSREEQLQRRALQACVDSSSGDLARALASLAASTSQHMAILDLSDAP